MKKISLNNIIEKFLIIFLCIQPIFDLKIFYNSYSTLIRVVIIFLFFIYFFLKSNNCKKYWLLLYPASLGIYFIFHHINALKFHSLVPGDFNYSMLKEALYFAKMLTPFLLIYSLYKSNLNKETIIKIIKTLVIIIGITIIFTNILGISYGSYNNEKIKANFFSWFNTDLSYMDLASKGFFEYANQIGAILISFLPFTIYSAFKSSNLKRKVADICILLINVFALILLCTRVSVLGIMVVFAFSIFSFMFVSYIQRRTNSNSDKCKTLSLQYAKKYVPLLSILLVYAILLPINPMFNRLDERNEVIETFAQAQTQSETELASTQIEEVSETNVNSPITIDPNVEKIIYIENNYKLKQIHEQFLLENYNYKYDPEFWYNFLKNDISLTTDYRYIEISLVKRVIEINNNPMDKLFGITNTRLQNIFNIEKDFVVQYYALGIIGLVLVFLPYFVLLAVFVYKTLKNKLQNLIHINVLAFISILFAFGISYFSGNLLNSLNFTIYFALLFTLLFLKDTCKD